MSDEEEDPNKKGNALPLWGNTQTMNINNLIITNIQSSAYFKNDLFKLKTFHEVIDEIYYKVSFLYSMYGFSTYSDRSKNLGWSLYSNSKKKQNHLTNKCLAVPCDYYFCIVSYTVNNNIIWSVVFFTQCLVWNLYDQIDLVSEEVLIIFIHQKKKNDVL